MGDERTISDEDGCWKDEGDEEDATCKLVANVAEEGET